MRRKRSRRLAVGRILQAGLATAVLVFGLMLAVSSMWEPTLAGVPATVAYNQFEQDVKDKKVRQATVDGNVIVATYNDSTRCRVLSPSPPWTVEVMVKYQVQVEAARALPGSGINLPVLGAILLPYTLLAYFVIGLVRAADSGIEIDVAGWAEAHPPGPSPEAERATPAASDDKEKQLLPETAS